MIGSQSVVDQAPRGGPPDIWPILNEDAGNLLLTRTLFDGSVCEVADSPETAPSLPFQIHICLRHNKSLLQHLHCGILLSRTQNESNLLIQLLSQTKSTGPSSFRCTAASMSLSASRRIKECSSRCVIMMPGHGDLEMTSGSRSCGASGVLQRD
jgi:hypothetical protein